MDAACNLFLLMLRDDIELAKRAIEKGFITGDQLRQILATKANDITAESGNKDSPPIGALLVQTGYLNAEQLRGLVAEIRGLPPDDAPGVMLTPFPLPSVPSASPQSSSSVKSAPAKEPSSVLPPPVIPPPAQAVDQQSFGKFMLVNRLGEGRIGALWRAWQKNLRRWVTLRIARTDSSPPFLDGAQRAAMLEHPGIQRIFEVGVHEGVPFAAMEYVKGRSLDHVLAAPQKRLLEIVQEILSAVQFAHERGVLHGNLKPSNVLLVETGDSSMPERALVVDFALPTAPSAYTAPEAVESSASTTVAADIYGVGALLYHALTGKAPYPTVPGPDMAAQIAQKEPPSPREITPSLPEELDAIVRRAMARRPEDRFPNAQSLAAALRTHARRSTASSRRRISRVQPQVKRGLGGLPLLVGALAILAMVIAIVAVILSNRRRHETTAPPQPPAPNGLEIAQPAYEQGRRRLEEADRLLHEAAASLEPHRTALQEALKFLEDAIRIHPAYADAHLRRAIALRRLGRDGEAEAALRTAIGLDPNMADAYLERADLLRQTIDLRIDGLRTKEVVRRRKDCSAAPPPDPFNEHDDLAQIRDRARNDLKRALGLRPAPYEKERIAADLAWLSWELSKAQDILDQMTREYPSREEIFMRRGRLRRVAAMEQLGTAVPEKERPERYAKALEEVIADFDQAASLRRSDVEARMQAGETCIEQATFQGFENAVKRFSEVLDLDPKNASARYQLGYAWLGQGKPRDAKQHFALCADLLPEAKEYAQLRAYAAWVARDKMDLEDAARRLTTKFPTDPMGWLFTAFAHLLESDYEGAERVLKKGLGQAPNDPVLAHHLGLVAELRDRLGEAREAYGQALRSADDLRETRVMRAQTCMLLGDMESAFDEFKYIPNPNGQIAAVYATMLLLVGHPKTIEMLERAADKPDCPPYLVGNLALALAWDGQRERAAKLLSDIFDFMLASSRQMKSEETGEWRRFWFAVPANAAMVLLELGRIDEAARMAEQAVQWAPQNIWAHDALAKVLEAKGDLQGSAKERQLAKDAHPTRGLVMNLRPRWYRYRLTFPRPGWPAEPRTIVEDVTPIVRDVVAIPKD